MRSCVRAIVVVGLLGVAGPAAGQSLPPELPGWPLTDPPSYGAVFGKLDGGERCAIGDVDGDGALDVVAGGYNGLGVLSLEYGVIGSFYDEPGTGLGLTTGYSIADVDGDGAGEIAFYEATGYDHEIYVVDSTFTPLPGFPYTSTDASTGQARQHTHFLDFDGDNDLEFAFTSAWELHILDLPNPSGLPVRVDWSGLDGKPSGSAYYHEGHTVPRFVRGDANADGVVDITDAVVALHYLFAGASAPCLRAVDANGDDTVDIVDPIVVLGTLFTYGLVPIAAPYPRCGRATESGVIPCDNPLDVSACP